jgi:hypothetical protein
MRGMLWACAAPNLQTESTLLEQQRAEGRVGKRIATKVTGKNELANLGWVLVIEEPRLTGMTNCVVDSMTGPGRSGLAAVVIDNNGTLRRVGSRYAWFILWYVQC